MTTNKPTTPSRWRDVRDAVGAGLIGAMVAEDKGMEHRLLSLAEQSEALARALKKAGEDLSAALTQFAAAVNANTEKARRELEARRD